MGAPIEIGRYRDGFFSACRPIRTTGDPQAVDSYEQAIAYAAGHAGAELVVPRSRGGTYGYDVFALSVGPKNDKHLAGAPASALHFGSDVPAAAGSPEALLIDESQQVRLFMPAGQQTDKAIGAHLLDHVRLRDVGGAGALAAGLAEAGLKGRVAALLDDLQSAKQKLDAAETTLKGQLASARQALAIKEAPYVRAVQDAKATLSDTVAQYDSLLRSRAEALREARHPGIGAAEAAVTGWQGRVGTAQTALARAKDERQSALSAVSHVESLEQDLIWQRDELQRVEFKIRDGYSYERQLREYERYQQQVAAGQHPPVVYPPHRPFSWSAWDSMGSLQADRDRLYWRIRQTEADLPRLREEAYRRLGRAEAAVEQATGELRYAQGQLDAARDRLNQLPAGDASLIRQAEQALQDAKTRQAEAVAGAQARVSDAETTLTVATRPERQAVQSLMTALQQAPAAYQAIVATLGSVLG